MVLRVGIGVVDVVVVGVFVESEGAGQVRVGVVTKLRFVFKFSTSNCSLENNYELKISFVLISQAKPEKSARL